MAQATIDVAEIERLSREWWKKRKDVPVREATTAVEVLLKRIRDLEKRLKPKSHDTSQVFPD